MNETLPTSPNSGSSLLEYGIVGAVLLVFVVPVFYGLFTLFRQREEQRAKQEERDAQFRSERERKLVDALVASVDQQKEALAQWRRFEDEERITHQALIAGLAQITQTLGQIGDRVASSARDHASNAAAQTQIAQLLGDVTQQIATLKRTA